MRASLSDILRSRSLVMDRRTEPKPKWDLPEAGVLGEAKDEGCGAFLLLLGPKGSNERRARKEGMPGPAGVVGCWGDAATAREGFPPFAP